MGASGLGWLGLGWLALALALAGFWFGFDLIWLDFGLRLDFGFGLIWLDSGLIWIWFDFGLDFALSFAFTRICAYSQPLYRLS